MGHDIRKGVGQEDVVDRLPYTIWPTIGVSMRHGGENMGDVRAPI